MEVKLTRDNHELITLIEAALGGGQFVLIYQVGEDRAGMLANVPQDVGMNVLRAIVLKGAN